MSGGVIALSRAALRGPGRLWGSYITKLAKNPVQTKMATSCAAALLGDAIAQHLSRPADDKQWKYDWMRTARLCMFNTGMGFLGHYYYTALDKRVVMKAPTAPITVASKVAIDQLVFTPLCCLLFYAFKVTAEGRPSEYISELQQKYVPTLIAGWKLWPAAHVINFAFIPTQHRILYANVVSVAGTYILSRAAAGDYSVSREVPAVTGSEKRRRGGNNEVLFDGVNVKMD